MTCTGQRSASDFPSPIRLMDGFYDCIGQGFQFVGRNRKSRREIDNISDWPDENALLDEVRTQAIQIIDAVEFDDPYGTTHADIFHDRHIPACRKIPFHGRRYVGDLTKPRFFFKEVERSVRGRASERISSICGPM